MVNALLNLHLNKYPYIMLCMFIMNIKEKTKLHLTESLQKRFKAIQHIVTVHQNALQKTQKPQKTQKTQKPQKTQKTQKTKSARIFCYIAFTHLLGSLYSEFNLWLPLHSTQQQKPILLIQQRHKLFLFASVKSCAVLAYPLQGFTTLWRVTYSLKALSWQGVKRLLGLRAI